VPDIPKEAVDAAEAARLRFFDEAPLWGSTTSAEVTRLMLEAAAPILAGHVAARIKAHADRQFPKADPAKVPGRPDLWRAWHRHFRIAAQVAALAFATEDDRKRIAAEALTTGNYVACPEPAGTVTDNEGAS
jgi:hypothetical protein